MHARWLGWLTLGLFAFAPWSLAGMELCVILLHLLVLYHRLREPVRDWLPHWVWLPFVALTAMAIVSSLAAQDPAVSFAQARGEYRLFLPFVLLVALAYVDRQRLLHVHAAFTMLLSVYGLVQYLFGLHLLPELANPYAAKGTFTMYLTYAGVMQMSAPVYASLAFAEHGRQRWLWGAAALLAAVAVVVSLGRAGWLGLGASALLLVPSLGWSRLRVVSVLGLAAAGLGLLSWVTFTDLPAIRDYREALREQATTGVLGRLVSFEDSMDNPRLPLWEAGRRGILDAPLLGHGFDYTTFDAYREAVVREWKVDLGSEGLWIHNIYLELAFMLGIPGLLLFLSMWGVLFAWCGRWIRRAGGRHTQERALLWGILAALGGSMVYGIFGGHFLDAEIQVNILMWMGLALSVGQRMQRELAPPEART